MKLARQAAHQYYIAARKGSLRGEQYNGTDWIVTDAFLEGIRWLANNLEFHSNDGVVELSTIEKITGSPFHVGES